MSKKFIKLNIDDNHLSLGNLFRIIKELSKNKISAMQTEIFCTLFEIKDINDTTVNNYCVGARSIGSDYKQIFINKNKKYQANYQEYTNNILGILSIIDGIIYHDINDKIAFINNNANAMYLSKKLYNIAKNDKQISNEFINNIKTLLNKNNYYEVLVDILNFIILEKKQPIYESDTKIEVLENILNDTSISATSLEEYLSLKLREGINYDYSLSILANNKNAYANFEIGTNEYYGYVKGYPRYDEALKYFLIAANQNHASSCYMVSRLYLDGLIGTNSKQELDKGFYYLNKAIDLGNIAALNKLGTMYLNGLYPVKKSKNKAIEFFKKSANANYAYAYNNLGKLEDNNDKAYDYYLKSANLGESWACNKVGEYLRNKGNLKEAYDYYNKALLANYHNICYYSYYNLAKYYYLNGNDICNKDYNKAINYLYEAANNNIIDAAILLLYQKIIEYKSSKNNNVFNEVLNIKKLIECNESYNEELKKDIEKKINDICKKGIDLSKI